MRLRRPPGAADRRGATGGQARSRWYRRPRVVSGLVGGAVFAVAAPCLMAVGVSYERAVALPVIACILFGRAAAGRWGIPARG